MKLSTVFVPAAALAMLAAPTVASAAGTTHTAKHHKAAKTKAPKKTKTETKKSK